MSNELNSNANTVKNDPQAEAVKKAVRKTWTINIFLFLALIVVFYLLYNKDHNKQVNIRESQKVQMTGQITQRDSVISEWITTFDDIQKNIALIREKEKLITINSKDPELAKSKKDQVLDDIQSINNLLEQNKKKIAYLNGQLAKSGGTIKALQTKISELETSMKQSEQEITDLKSSLVNKNFEISQLNTQVDQMVDTLSKKEEKIATQTVELNKAFYVVGTYKELKAKGLLTKEGGFIGLGKTEKVVGNFSDDAFTRIDINSTTSIALNVKTAKLITEHPGGSYEFKTGADKKIVSLEIKDPAQFWKIAKYAVIETTK
jgi:uncharacterized coiled-coil protein SlyX